MSETVAPPPEIVVELEDTKEEKKLLESPRSPQGAEPVPSIEVSETHPAKPTEIPEDSEGSSDSCGGCLMVMSVLTIILFFPFSLLFALQMVQEYERAVIFRLGRILHGGAKGPGLFSVYPCLDSIEKVDLRTKSIDINPQEILTKDHVTVTVDAVMYLKVIDPVLSVTKVENVLRASKMLAATTLRNVLGTYNMNEILSRRDNVNETMKEILDEATDPWGVDVERVEITDVRLPDILQRAMAAEAEATRDAKAKVISAEGEQKAARALKEAADIMSEAPAALQLRYLQTLNTIAAEQNSTIVFPLPMEMFQSFRGMAMQQQPGMALQQHPGMAVQQQPLPPSSS